MFCPICRGHWGEGAGRRVFRTRNAVRVTFGSEGLAGARHCVADRVFLADLAAFVARLLIREGDGLSEGAVVVILARHEVAESPVKASAGAKLLYVLVFLGAAVQPGIVAGFSAVVDIVRREFRDRLDDANLGREF